jgi:hypothetical protein
MSVKKVILGVILIFGTTSITTPTANAIFGIGDCKAVKSKISGLESRVVRDLNYIKGLTFVRPSVNSAQGVKLYEKYQSAESGLKAIQIAGKSKPKCFNLKQTGAIGNPVRWSISTYVVLLALSEKYYISGTLKYQPLGNLK